MIPLIGQPPRLPRAAASNPAAATQAFPPGVGPEISWHVCVTRDRVQFMPPAVEYFPLNNSPPATRPTPVASTREVDARGRRVGPTRGADAWGRRLGGLCPWP
ncbi:MAG: hypothetical protein R6U98_11680 [Pirellulaceae bacterium]